MKQPLSPRISIAFCAAMLFLVFSCESKKPGKITAPQEFNPVEEVPDKTAVKVDSVQEEAEPEMPEISETKAARKPMPTAAELKAVSPDLEAKRALNNDAMKAAQMKPDAFIAYMKTRIPYYKGKGNLKAENDMVRIRISKTEMKIETVKGSQTFPMQ
ncbi:hypothetical protein [Adhaeribacter terreus]|uniref:Lipoprotein n=1 Tax=Adhaeribacter terreus TaxID=529703 RepID=A0ABW0EFK1_9BACT